MFSWNEPQEDAKCEHFTKVQFTRFSSEQSNNISNVTSMVVQGGNYKGASSYQLYKAVKLSRLNSLSAFSRNRIIEPAIAINFYQYKFQIGPEMPLSGTMYPQSETLNYDFETFATQIMSWERHCEPALACTAPHFLSVSAEMQPKWWVDLQPLAKYFCDRHHVWNVTFPSSFTSFAASEDR